MGIFSRMADIVNANLNSLLDKAEDPQKMVRLIIQEMEEGLVKERSNLARYLVDKKELARQLKRHAEEGTGWQAKAELALQRGRDDLAKAALMEKAKQGRSQALLEQEMVAVEEGISKLEGEIRQLEGKLEDARARQKAMLLRSAAASSRLQVQHHGRQAQPHTIVEKFDRMERKIEEMESKADVFAQGNPSLEQQFMELEADEAIEQELEALKAKMNKTQGE